MNSKPSRRVPAGGYGGFVWLVLIIVGFLTGVGGQAVQVPAPYLLAALVVGAAAALSGRLSTTAAPSGPR